MTAYNAGEDMRAGIRALGPARWKVFQCLLLEGENTGGGGELRVRGGYVIVSTPRCCRHANFSLGSPASARQRWIGLHLPVPRRTQDAARFVVSEEEFARFVDRHSELGAVLVPEDNADMRRRASRYVVAHHCAGR